jgi:hypothetical protein
MAGDASTRFRLFNFRLTSHSCNQGSRAEPAAQHQGQQPHHSNVHARIETAAFDRWQEKGGMH